MSSIGWVIRPITRVLLNAPPTLQKREKKSVVEYFLPRITGGWIGKRQIIYVWDWSVSSDPIISWDVNYTVLSLHVKRQIIEEGKRCATLYLCFHLELVEDCPSLVRFLSLFFLLSFFCPWCIYCWVILHCQSWSFCKDIIHDHYRGLCVCVCVCVCVGYTQDSSVLSLYSLSQLSKIIYMKLSQFKALEGLEFVLLLQFISIWNVCWYSPSVAKNCGSENGQECSHAPYRPQAERSCNSSNFILCIKRMELSFSIVMTLTLP